MSQTCYWPNGGGIANGHTPCVNTTSGDSACCASTHYCFDNGLCLDNTEMTTYRGACTDETWGSDACAKFCLSTTSGALYNGVCGVWACNNDNQFSCDYQTCGNSSEMFKVSGGTIQRNAALNSVITSAATTTASTTSFTTPATVSTSIPSAISSTCPSAAATCPSHSGALAGIGAGLGVPLLLSLIALVVLFLQLRKNKQRAGSAPMPVTEHKQYSTPAPMSPNSFANGQPPTYKYTGQRNAELPAEGAHAPLSRTELAS